MLFNSLEFIFLFLPFTVILFFILSRAHQRLGILALTVASIFFYGYWDHHFLVILIGSILFNYLIGRIIVFLIANSNPRLCYLALISGITGDLVLLGCYKYSNFIVTLGNHLTHAGFPLPNLILPLGISFFTFTQIAYLVDCYRNEAKEYNFLNYLLFVTYFPHLIAGPILHHKEMIPQFNNPRIYKQFNCIIPGLTLFAIGLFKKVFFADGVSGIANTLFNAAQTGEIATIDAWTGALAYTMQIYFDFSGYSDMAIGLSFLFGIRLPVNFFSPYKSTSMIDFWRRWHMTLSRFLRDYLYIPMGGSRKGPFRRYINLIVTMILGGFWHGAGWTFLIWGTLHGFYLAINHGWRFFCQRFNLVLSGHFFRIFSALLTFLCVTVAWVFFRSPDTDTALTLVHSMFGMHSHSVVSKGIQFSEQIMLGGLLIIAWLAPNSLQIMRQVDIALAHTTTFFSDVVRWYQWRISPIWGMLTGFVLGIGILGVLAVGDAAEFLYFQF